MHQLSRVLRVNCFLSPRRPFLNAPPCLVYPTSSFFSTSPTHRRYQVPKRKREATMSNKDMTTLKGKPFDRVSLESLMRVGEAVELFGVILTDAAAHVLHSRF